MRTQTETAPTVRDWVGLAVLSIGLGLIGRMARSSASRCLRSSATSRSTSLTRSG